MPRGRPSTVPSPATSSRSFRLAVVGHLPGTAGASAAFTAFIREANRGTQTWFVASEAELRERLATAAEPGS
jgi:hypothetical protein